jgi:hypothetical protein
MIHDIELGKEDEMWLSLPNGEFVELKVVDGKLKQVMNPKNLKPTSVVCKIEEYKNG